MGIFGGIKICESGLNAERLRIDIVSSNVANIRTTRTEEGGAYIRRVPSFIESFDSKMNVSGVEVYKIEKDQSPLRKEYDPTHPDANEDGYVEYPNVDILVEMSDLISASRAYESNIETLNAQKNMISKALEIGR